MAIAADESTESRRTMMNIAKKLQDSHRSMTGEEGWHSLAVGIWLSPLQ